MGEGSGLVRRREALKYCAMLAGSVKGRQLLASWLPSGTEMSMANRSKDASAAFTDPGENENYQPTFFKPHEYETVRALTEIILPTDEKPGAKEARVVQFIDFVVAGAAEFMPGLQREWIEGLARLDKESNNRFGQDFRAVSPSDRILLLTEMSLPERDARASHPGFPFYKLVKEMTVEGFYSSRVGLLDVLEYKGLAYLASFPGCTHPDH